MLYCARELIGENPSSLRLATTSIAHTERNCVQQLMDAYHQHGKSIRIEAYTRVTNCIFGTVQAWLEAEELLNVTEFAEANH
jgi:UTP-glucose-1-phosphate uridylyltransferase